MKKELFLIPGHPFSNTEHANHNGQRPMVESNAPALYIDQVSELPSTGWTASASDSYVSNPASNLIDNNSTTIWHSDYTPNPDTPLPHWVKIDMKKVSTVSRITYLPRQTGVNGQIGRYQVLTSLDGTAWTPVADGTWADAPTSGSKPRQYADFRPTAARYIQLNAITEAANRGPWSSIAELDIYGSQNNFMTMPRNNWTVTVTSSQSGFPLTNLTDNSNTTIWQSSAAANYPHTVTIDTKVAKKIRGLSYLPRQDGSADGRIGDYQIAVSGNGTSWSTVKSGKWLDDPNEQAAVFAPVSARYVRLTAFTEAGNRGPWATIANLSLYDTVEDLPALPRRSWTISASDQSGANPAANLLDGNARTIWHSNFDTNPDAPLPHSVTIDMKANRTLAGLSYVPRQDATAAVNGNIGSYRVEVSTDNLAWQQVDNNVWKDDKSTKFSRFAPISARYARLTALTEAGNRGPWSSGSEIYLHSVAPTSTAGGSWSTPIGFPLAPTSAAVLPNNKLLVFAAYTNLGFSTSGVAVTKIAILDLNTNTISQPPEVDTDHEMFCSGLAMTADGKLLINGGSNDTATTIYDPFSNTWTKGPLMKIPRAYESTTLLSDGRIFTLGGSWIDPFRPTQLPDKDGEVLDLSSSAGWQVLSSVTADNIMTADPGGRYAADNHPWLIAWSNGTVFHAGPSKQMNWISTSGNGSISSAGLRGSSKDAMNGNAVMYEPGKILTVGGAEVYRPVGAIQNAQAHRAAHIINILSGFNNPASVTSGGQMSYSRSFANSVVLPDGSVLVLGGQQHPEPFTDTAAAMSPELWSATTNSFKIMSPETIPRTYHSLAVLLPDGRVFSAGGGLCGGCLTNHTDGQYFTPPYLINSNGTLKPRPTINSAPTEANVGGTFSVTTTNGTSKFSLVRMSSVTHSINTDQRRIPLTGTTIGTNTYQLTLPNDSGVVLPGYYMLFTFDASNTPSVAKIIKIR